MEQPAKNTFLVALFFKVRALPMIPKLPMFDYHYFHYYILKNFRYHQPYEKFMHLAM